MFPKNTDKHTPEIAHETAPMIPDVSDLPNLSKPRRNSLTGLPQYDPDQYGHGKARCAATSPCVDETGLVVEVNGKGEVEIDDAGSDVLAVCFREAAHTLSAAEDQPIVENAINRTESRDWKCAIN